MSRRPILPLLCLLPSLLLLWQPLGAQQAVPPRDVLDSRLSQRQFEELGLRHLPMERADDEAVVARDFDGDRVLDLLIVRSSGSPRMVLRLGGKGARFRDAGLARFAQVTDSFRAVAAGDIDGDGDLDFVTVATGNAGGPKRVWRNDGKGYFTMQVLGKTRRDSEGVLLFDANGDGKLDLYVANAGSPFAEADEFFLGDGKGSFTDQSSLALPPLKDLSQAVVAGDFDGDRDLDLLVLALGQNRLLLGNGKGRFVDGSSTALPVEGDASRTASVGDLDGDGDLDFIVGNGIGALAQYDKFYLNDSKGAFRGLVLSATKAVTAASLLLDVDGDKDLDVVLAHAGTGRGSLAQARQDMILLNNGSAVFGVAKPGTLPRDIGRASDLAHGDFDGDGREDLVVLNLRARNALLFGDGLGRFEAGSTLRIDCDDDTTTGLLAFDADRDGYADLLALNRSFTLGQQNRLYLGDSYGALRLPATSAALLPVRASFTQSAAAGDVNGDGFPDLCLANSGSPVRGSANRLLLGSAKGVFKDAAATSLPVDSAWSQTLLLRDLDGDGKKDLYFGNGYPIAGVRGAQDFFYKGNGRGSFSDLTQARLPKLSVDTKALAAGDVNGDGRLDVVLAASPYFDAQKARFVGGQTLLLLGTSTGALVLAPSSALPSDNDDSSSLLLIDVDGDKDLDLVLGNRGRGKGEQNRLYLGDGKGAFTDASAKLPQGPSVTEDLVAGDIDEDGDLDLIEAHKGGVRILLGDGTGAFRVADRSRIDFSDGPALGLALTDLDNDRDLDLVIAMDGENRVLINHLRQISAPYLARLGSFTPVLFSARRGFAPKGQVQFPFIGLLESFPPAPLPFGPWRIRLAGLFFLYALPVPEKTGEVDFPLWIPTTPSLLGQPLHLQSLLVDGPNPATWRFTPLARLTVHR